MENKTLIQDLVLLLKNGSNEVKSSASDELLSISGTETMIDDLLQVHHLLNPELVRLMQSDNEIALKAGSILVNLSSYESGVKTLLCQGCDKHKKCRLKVLRSSLFGRCVEKICDPNSKLADICCMILSNITRDYAYLLNSELNTSIVERIMEVLFDTHYNKAGCNLQHLPNAFANMVRCFHFSSYIKDKSNLSRFKKNILESVHSIELLGHEDKLRKRGLLASYKNLILNPDEQHVFLDESLVRLFTSALFTFVNSIKDDLESHTKGEKKSLDPELCLLVVEILLLFCATRQGRVLLRDCDVYIALKEVHSTCPDKEIEIATEKVVDILIRTEEEIGVDNYFHLDIPKELREDFEKCDLEDEKEIKERVRKIFLEQQKLKQQSEK